MNRAPFVLVGTVAGLAGLLSFTSTPAKITLGTLGAPPTTTTFPPTTTRPTAGPTTTSPGGQTPPPTTTAPVTTTTTGGVRSATGSSVNYFFGILSVKVTVSGTKITNAKIAAINDGGNSHSIAIDQMAIPLLEQETLRAQSANIQGVSGASYTSAGFAQSLQSALKQLGI